MLIVSIVSGHCSTGQSNSSSLFPWGRVKLLKEAFLIHKIKGLMIIYVVSPICFPCKLHSVAFSLNHLLCSEMNEIDQFSHNRGDELYVYIFR